MEEEQILYTLLVCGILALLGFLGDRLFQRTSVPDILVLLLAGILIGPVLGLVDVRQISVITPYFGTLAMIFILFDGGLELDFDMVLRQFLPVMLLATLSIGTVVAGVSLVMIHCFEWHWLPATLLGTLLSNTSGAIVMPVVSRLSVPEDEKALLKLEAAVSDILQIVLFVTLMSILADVGGGNGAQFDLRPTLTTLFGSFCVAIVLGTLLGSFWVLVLNRIHVMRHNYIATLGTILVLYSVSEYVGASGMMAILFFGLVLANAGKFGQFLNLEEVRFTTEDLRKMHTTFSFFVRTFFLVYVGFFVTADMFRMPFVLRGLLIMGILVAGRAVTAVLSARALRKDRLFAWAACSLLPRGLAVAALAAAPARLVEDMHRHRQEALAAVEAEVSNATEGLRAVQAEKRLAADKGDDAAAAKLAERELELAATARFHEGKVDGLRAARDVVSVFREPARQFILFGSMSILVTNVLMTFGFLWMRRFKPSPTAGSGPIVS